MEAKKDVIADLLMHNDELEQKLKKLLIEFTQTRTRAQEMLVQRDVEIKKLKSLNNKQDNEENPNNSGIDDNILDTDSDYEERKEFNST